MAIERTFSIIKPDATRRNLTGKVNALIDYAVHRERPFFGELVDFIVSSPLVAIALEGPNAVAICRAINGATRPHEAAPGSIRGDFALDTGKNLVHASDSVENAQAELALWFTAGEIHGWERANDRWILPV